MLYKHLGGYRMKLCFAACSVFIALGSLLVITRASNTARGAAVRTKAFHAHQRLHGHRGRLAASSGFAILGRAPTASDRENGAVAALAQHMPTIQVSRARRLVTDAAGRTIWLIPTTDNQLCAAREDASGGAGGACETVEEVEARGLVAGVIGDLFGIVPDGVAEVTVQDSGGTSSVVKVTQNVYRIPRDAVRLTFGNADGTQTLDLPGD